MVGFIPGKSSIGQAFGLRDRVSSLIPEKLIPEKWRRGSEALAEKQSINSYPDSRTAALNLAEPPKLTAQARLEELRQFPQPDMSLAEVFQLIREDRGAFMKTNLVKEVLSETLAANLNNFSHSPQAVQDSLIVLSEVLGSAHSGLLSSSERKSLVKEAVQPMIDKYLAHSSAGAETAPDIYKAETGFEKTIRGEEQASLRALKDALMNPKLEATLRGAVLMRRDEEAVIPQGVRTFTELREHLLTLLDKNIQSASGSIENTMNESARKPSFVKTIADRSIKEQLTDLIKLERDFFQKILLPKYSDLVTAIKASSNSTDLVQQLKSSLGSLPASVGRNFLSSLVNGMADHSKPLAEAV